MFNTNSDGILSKNDLERVTECMGFDFLSASDILLKYSHPLGFNYEVFKTMVKDLANQFKKQDGRFYVLLSLEEAEHFRAIIHGRKNSTLLASESSNLMAMSGPGSLSGSGLGLGTGLGSESTSWPVITGAVSGTGTGTGMGSGMGLMSGSGTGLMSGAVSGRLIKARHCYLLSLPPCVRIG